MIIIRDIKVKLNNDLNNQRNALIKKSASLLRVRQDKIKDLQIKKRSIDARKKPEIFYNYQVVVSVEDEDRILKANKSNKIDRYKPVYYKEPEVCENDDKKINIDISANKE